jgi:hypothetical protein
VVLVSKLDEFGKAAWIAAAVFGFWVFWPIGLAITLFLAFSGRTREWRGGGRGRWRNMDARNCRWGEAPVSGNRAFDEYRSETLRRLEEEQREFIEYLERLRQAKDKAEFDQFMAERRRGPQMPEQPTAN